MIRKNYLTGEHIFFSQSRGNRPLNFKESPMEDISVDKCPFCPENEYMTPKRIYSTNDEKIRIVSNKYPFVEASEQYFSEHDVVIDTPFHNQKIENYSCKHIKELMITIKSRQEELEKNENVKYVQVFKNNGAYAGASQPHSHWQITALPILPEKIEKMSKAFCKYIDENKKYFFENCDSKYIIEENKYFRVFCPWDSKFSYEIDIAPLKHTFSIKIMSDEELENLGFAIQNAIKRLQSVCGNISFNICFYSSPANEYANDKFSFFVQIIPRIGNMAGFEFSTGCFINSVYPEKAAKWFRECLEIH